MSKNSNQERARIREQCRIQIAEYIERTLGIKLDPQVVRLHPTEHDPYLWKYLPHSQHLFQKRISKHNIRSYREIIRELGVSIEVVAKQSPLTLFEITSSTAEDTNAHSTVIQAVDTPCRRCFLANSVEDAFPQRGFTSTIADLQEENRTLNLRLTDVTARLAEQDLLVARMLEEKEDSAQHISQLRSTLQHRNVEAAQRTKAHLKDRSRIDILENWIREWQLSAPVAANKTVQHFDGYIGHIAPLGDELASIEDL